MRKWKQIVRYQCIICIYEIEQKPMLVHSSCGNLSIYRYIFANWWTMLIVVISSHVVTIFCFILWIFYIWLVRTLLMLWIILEIRCEIRHNYVMTWKPFLHITCLLWMETTTMPFVRWNHQSPVDSHHKGSVISFVFFDVSLNKMFHKQTSFRCYETLCC